MERVGGRFRADDVLPEFNEQFAALAGRLCNRRRFGHWVGHGGGTQSGDPELINPQVAFFHAVPPIAWIPLLIIMVGIGNAPIIT